MKNIEISAATSILEAAPIGMLMLDADGHIHWYNQTLLDTLGLDEDQLQAHSLDTLPSDIRSVLVDPPETIFLQKGTEQRWLRCQQHQTGDNHKIHYYIDISQEQRLLAERDKLAEELQMLTTRDAVTGLPNRRALLQGLEPLVSRSRRYGNPLSVIKLNITLTGEATQQTRESSWIEVGQMLKDQMRWADIIGRYEDADFLLILPETPLGAARTLAEKIAKLVAQISVADEQGRKLGLQPHCGVTAWKKGDDSILLLKRAEEGITTARESGETVVTVDANQHL